MVGPLAIGSLSGHSALRAFVVGSRPAGAVWRKRLALRASAANSNAPDSLPQASDPTVGAQRHDPTTRASGRPDPTSTSCL